MPYQFGKLTIFRLGEEGSGTKLKSGDGYQDYDEILRECLASGKLFEDPEFPLTEETLKEGAEEPGNLLWKRPSEIEKALGESEDDEKKVVFSAQEKGDKTAICRFDVKQGGVSNCGSVAAFASSTVHAETQKIIFPDNNSFEEGEYAGVFHFRVYRMGRWLDVVVDDRIPVDAEFHAHSIGPIASGKVREYWPCLLEKVRAKLGQSYEGELTGGGSIALELFTGGCMEDVDITEDGAFARLQKIWDTGAVGEIASFGKEEDGMINEHGYSVTGLANVETTDGEKIELIRLRNPWGSTEFNGPWSDTSNEWDRVSQKTKEDLELVVRVDGEFWMALADFPKYTGDETVKIVALLPEELDKPKPESWNWNYIKHLKSWTEDHIYEKPGADSQFCFTIEREEPAWVVISFSTLSSVLGIRADESNQVGYKVYKLDEDDTEFPIEYSYLRSRDEIGGEEGALGTSLDPRSWKLESGNYMVYVYINKFPPNSADFEEFALRILHEK